MGHETLHHAHRTEIWLW